MVPAAPPELAFTIPIRGARQDCKHESRKQRMKAPDMMSETDSPRHGSGGAAAGQVTGQVTGEAASQPAGSCRCACAEGRADAAAPDATTAPDAAKKAGAGIPNLRR